MSAFEEMSGRLEKLKLIREMSEHLVSDMNEFKGVVLISIKEDGFTIQYTGNEYELVGILEAVKHIKIADMDEGCYAEDEDE